MKVSELIEKLAALNAPDAVVTLQKDKYGTMFEARLVKHVLRGEYEELKNDKYEYVRPVDGTVEIDSLD